MTLHYWTQCDELLNKPHLLIAGATGSGKSVLVNSLIYTMLTYQPTEKQMILIDPKRVELYGYRDVPHCLAYASEFNDIIALLKRACEVMDNRYREMQLAGLRMYEGSDIYIIIDEFADLVTMTKGVEPLVQRLAQLGRASRMHLWIATQSPSRKTLPAATILNVTDRIALHCNDKIESRQILGVPGAEELPRYGKGLYKSAEGLRMIDIPLTGEQYLNERVRIWT